MPAAKHMPALYPTRLTVMTHDRARQYADAKHMPRAPKDGEVLAIIQRPQAGGHEFLLYVTGDFVVGPDGTARVVVTTPKRGYYRGGEGYKVYEQVAVLRDATDADRAALAPQFAARAARDKAVSAAWYDR